MDKVLLQELAWLDPTRFRGGPILTPDLQSIENNLPELVKLDHWVLWRAVWEQQVSGIWKYNKIPIDPLTLENARSNDSSTWSGFTASVNAFLKHADEFAGIGFMLPATEPMGIVGIDFDKIKVAGEIIELGSLPDQKRRHIELLDTYTEYSPSDTGLRCFGFAELPGTRRKSPEHNFEYYELVRFLTVTGRSIHDIPKPIRKCQEAINILYMEVFPKAKKIPKSQKTSHKKDQTLSDAEPAPALNGRHTLTDNEVKTMLFNSKYGSKAVDLYKGKVDTVRYPSESEADLAFCNHLAFYTGDPDQIDRLYRESKLYRPKWDSSRGVKTYGELTISKALDRDDTDCWQPDYQKGATIDPQENEEGEVLDQITQVTWTDQGNAEELIAEYGENMRYDPDNKWWFIWDNSGVWKVDKTGSYAMRCVVDIAKRYLCKAEDVDVDADLAKKYAAHGKKSLQEPKLQAAISLARHIPGVQARYTDFDRQPYLFNCANGTLNLETGELQPHRREDMLTKISPVRYDPHATAPTWHRFLNEIFSEERDPDGNWVADESFLKFVQRDCGYGITGSTKEHSLSIYHGSGRNGKSVFIKIRQAIMADYAKTAAIETLMVKQNRGVPNDIADLCGARFVSAVETESGQQLAQALVKNLTGGDSVKGRFLFREFFEFMPTYKIAIACNFKPIIDGSDKAIVARLRLIPFNVKFESPDENPNTQHIKDPDMDQKLLGELPGILNWLVEGARLWLKEGLGTHEKVRVATSDYATEMDSVKSFVKECCVVGEEYSAKKIRAAELIEAYKKFCIESNLNPKHAREFKGQIEGLGATHGRDNRGAFYRNIDMIRFAETEQPETPDPLVPCSTCKSILPPGHKGGLCDRCLKDLPF